MKCKILVTLLVMMISFSTLFAADPEYTGHKNCVYVGWGWGTFTIYLNDGENGKEGPAYWVKSSVMDSEDMKRFYALALLCFSTGATLDIEWNWDGENS